MSNGDSDSADLAGTDDTDVEAAARAAEAWLDAREQERDWLPALCAMDVLCQGFLSRANDGSSESVDCKTWFDPALNEFRHAAQASGQGEKLVSDWTLWTKLANGSLKNVQVLVARLMDEKHDQSADWLIAVKNAHLSLNEAVERGLL